MVDLKTIDTSNLPLLRAEETCYLEELQRGNVFMRNAAYYQKLEDKAIADTYETAVPIRIIIDVDGRHIIPPYRNTRLASFGWYIKCFYQFQPSDIGYDGDGKPRLYLSEKSKEWFLSTKHDNVIKIDRHKLMERFNSYCTANGLFYKTCDVCYKNADEYREYTIEYAMEYMKFLFKMEFNRDSKDLVECKRDIFSHQQEFRLCVSHYELHNRLSKKHGSRYESTDDEWRQMFVEANTISIGSLKDISTIIPLHDVIEYGIPL